MVDGKMPPMYNYNGKKFNIEDLMGDVDKDKDGNIVPKKSKKGDLIDNKGRRINERGYLIDKDGNITDKNGKQLWKKKHLDKLGEFPKIFDFTRFNPADVTGDFERDKNDNPILKKNDRG